MTKWGGGSLPLKKKKYIYIYIYIHTHTRRTVNYNYYNNLNFHSTFNLYLLSFFRKKFAIFNLLDS
uniref:Uncharacterized protein n=1 Tax=Octopus bimaculoides TaxID=37653 RepID=A0A0L8H439_OCTBM